MNKIALVMPYFGKLPDYFPYYLQSLAKIRLDVLFVTDLQVPNAPENLRVVRMSLEDVRKLAAEKLHSMVALGTPKKLCDFKPMYGKIFEDYLKPYDYWAMGDCDVVYGTKFNEFLDFILKSEYDLVSMRREWISGSFCALRNVEKMCRLYERARNWREVAQETGPNNFFDECGGAWYRQLESGEMTMADCEKLRDSFGAVVWRSEDVAVWRQDRVSEENLAGHLVMRCSNGKLLHDGKEIYFYHLLGVKFRRYCVFPRLPEGVDAYVIDEAGIYVSKLARTLRPVVRLFRKTRAICQSVRDNGIGHWIYRLVGIKK